MCCINIHVKCLNTAVYSINYEVHRNIHHVKYFNRDVVGRKKNSKKKKTLVGFFFFFLLVGGVTRRKMEVCFQP